MLTDEFDNAIVLEAIERLKKTNNPKRFAESNQSAYFIAVETLKIVQERIEPLIKRIELLSEEAKDDKWCGEKVETTLLYIKEKIEDIIYQKS